MLANYINTTLRHAHYEILPTRAYISASDDNAKPEMPES